MKRCWLDGLALGVLATFLGPACNVPRERAYGGTEIQWGDCEVGQTRSCECDGKAGTQECEPNWVAKWGTCSACSAGEWSPLPEGAECTFDGLCAAGLVCGSPDLPQCLGGCKMICRSTLPMGRECSVKGMPCASGLACNFASDVPVCLATGMFGADCRSAACLPGLECNPLHSPAQCRPPGGLDDPCLGDPPASCAPGLVCNGALDPEPDRGACAEPGGLGEKCEESADCAQGTSCLAGACA